MVFSSFVFLFWFLPIAFLAYWIVPVRARNLMLTVVSYLFYGWERPDFIVLLLFSTTVDYCASLAMGPPGSSRPRKLLLFLSLLTNLGLLGYFKYANLAVSTWNDLTPAGMSIRDWQQVFLPVGISFFTFQSMSYTIDVYWGTVKPVRSILDLACYVSMFPQLVAGPIVRYRDIEGQLLHRSVDLRWISTGALLFMVGFSKKILIADTVAPIADAGFALQDPGFLAAWSAVLAYTVQIYFDFSGYSDMAIGLGLALGFTFPRNFHSPYKSRSITEFWRRWHISLSTWLRDYLYIPLGGNRGSEPRTYLNLMATMLLGGLWHGASWVFLLWGAYQGLWLVLERPFRRNILWSWLPQRAQVFPAFLVVMGGWVIFRATSMANLGDMWAGMVGAAGLGEVVQLEYYQAERYAWIGIGLLIAWFTNDSWSLANRFRPTFVLTACGLFYLAVAKLLATDYSPFLYFQF